MTSVERDIRSTPAILQQTLARLDRDGGVIVRQLHGPVVFLGCGSSYCLAASATALYEESHGEPAQAIVASDYRPWRDWTHVAISRSGTTTEVVEAMRQARRSGARVLLISGDVDTPAETEADAVLRLEFAAERGVIQTRFITATLLALRVLIGGDRARAALQNVPERLDDALAAFDPTPNGAHDHVVYLGRGWRHGLALAGALNVQETALLVAEGHQTLDYRHGPIACASEDSLVWCLDPRDDGPSSAVLDDVRRTGATVWQTDDDPIVTLSQAQLLAVRMAERRGVNPDAPRHLARSVVLPALGA
jgi:glucosamine--fructose-6-phosphate aminotransferase (isomerizing)